MSYYLGHFFVIIYRVMIFLSVAQLCFVIIIPILVVAVVLVALYFLYYKKYIANNFKKHCYRKIHNIANFNDYYLINNFTFTVDDLSNIVIDHILFGNKYIFVITDRYIDGDLTGKDSDSDLVVINKNGSKAYAGGNPYLQSNQLLRRLSVSTGLNSEMMIAITLINDEARININSSSKQFFIVQRKKLAKLIKIIESREVGEINAPRLKEAVQVIASLNLRDK